MFTMAARRLAFLVLFIHLIREHVMDGAEGICSWECKAEGECRITKKLLDQDLVATRARDWDKSDEIQEEIEAFYYGCKDDSAVCCQPIPDEGK